MSTIRSKSAGWNGGVQQEFYVIVTFCYDWRESFIRLLLGQLCLYGTECWVMKRYHAQKMSAVEMRSIRWMCGNTRRDKVRNDDIRTKIGIVSIKENVRENCLWWFGHVRRTPTDAPVLRVECIKLGQVKKHRGDRRKHEWRWYDKIYRLKVLIKAYCLIGMSEERWSMCPIRRNYPLFHVASPKYLGQMG